MNKTIKRNVVISAILAIMLCVSLIAGATFALFTSESKVNIAVTSGKVDVKASIADLKLYSAVSVSKTAVIDGEYKDVTENKTFTNGGTAAFDDEGNLTLNKMTPGDKAEFNIHVENNSNVAAIYRTSITVSNDTGLYEALDIKVDDSKMSTRRTAWANMGFTQKDYAVVIELPASATAQDVECTLTFKVEAMQGNAVINDITAAELAKILTTPNEQGVVELNKDYDVIDDWTSLTGLPENSEGVYTLNGNGHTITGLTMPLFGANPASGIIIENLTIADSDIGSIPSTVNSKANVWHSGAFIAGLDNGVKILTLNNCHTSNVNVTASKGSASSAGALIGWTCMVRAGIYVDASSFSITNCTVTGGSVKNAYGNAAGIVGMCQTDSSTDSKNNTCSYKIENCSVNGCTIKGEAEDKTGAIVGTVNGSGTLYINKCTYTGKAYGRIVNAQAIIDGVPHVTTLAQFTNAVNNTEYSKIVLAADITSPILTGFRYALERDLTVDFGGHTLTTAPNLFEVKNGATLTLISSVEGGKLYCNSNQGGPVTLIKVDKGATLNIEDGVEIDCSMQFTLYYPMYTIHNYGTVNMNGGKIIQRNGVAVMGQGDFVFNMNGGEIVLMSDLRDADTMNLDYATGVSGDNNSTAKINFNGGKVSGDGKLYETYSNEQVTTAQTFINEVKTVDAE